MRTKKLFKPVEWFEKRVVHIYIQERISQIGK